MKIRLQLKVDLTVVTDALPWQVANLVQQDILAAIHKATPYKCSVELEGVKYNYKESEEL
jgi:hypothetical protein